jgi:hypothetical protein
MEKRQMTVGENETTQAVLMVDVYLFIYYLLLMFIVKHINAVRNGEKAN